MALLRIVPARFILGLLVALTLPFGPAAAQPYPDRPISLIIQFAPGTTTDFVGRRFAELLGKELGTSVIPVNRPGAGGAIGVGEIARAAPDGYTIGLVNLPALAIIPHIQKPAYDPLNDFHHIGVIGPYEYGIYVSAQSPFQTWEELAAHARANGAKVSYGTPGIGTTNHLLMARLGKDLGADWVHAPFKGDGEIIPNVLGGHVTMGVGSPGAIVPQVKSGKLRLLLVTSKDRWRDLPEVPTIQDKGFKYFQGSFLSLAGPAKLPEPIKQRLDAGVRKLLTDPAVIAEMRDKLSTIIVYQGGPTYANFVREQHDFYRDFLKTLKLN
jgi:tripartite-type tricarboxylate transporter receptor subunit TctC